MAETPHAITAPSAWVRRWAPRVPAGARVLDLACGRGRHAHLFAARGCIVTAVDRDSAALESLRGAAGIAVEIADLEADPWPYTPGQFDAIVVTNYLHRPLFAAIAASVAPGGCLIYETFMRGNEKYGRPSNPAFLLAPDELSRAFAGALTTLGFEQGRVRRPALAVVQRYCGVRGAADEVEIE